MSQQVENRTVKIFIDDQDVQKKLDNARQNLEKLKERAKNLDVGSKAFEDVNKQIEATQKNIDIYDGQLKGKFGATLRQLKTQQAQLNKELANMPIELRATSEQAKKLSLVEAELRKIKVEAASSVDILRGFGPIGNQIADIWDGISSGAKKAVSALGTVRGAIAATGIGALVLAVISLVQWFQKTDEGANRLDSVFRMFSATVDLILNKIWNFRDTLREFVSDPIKFFQNLGKDIKAAATEAGALAYVFDELDDRRRKMELTASELDKQITQYVRQSKNITLSFIERIALIDKASALEKEKLKTQLDYQNDLIKAIERENALKIKSGTLTDADQDKLNQAMVQRNQLQTESIRLEERIANDRDKYVEAEIEGINKAKDAKAKAEAAKLKLTMDEFEKEMQAQIDNQRTLAQMEADLLADDGQKLIDAEMALLQERQNNWEGFAAEIEKFETEKFEKSITAAESYIGAAMQLQSTFLSMVKNRNQAQQAEQTAQDNREKAALKQKLADKLITQEQYEAAITAIDEKAIARDKENRRREAEVEKKFAIFTSLLQASLAVLKAIVKPTPETVAAAIAAGLQAGIVAATPIPAFAKGTDFAPGGMALVGEEGPELVNLPRGSKVFTAAQTNKMIGVPEFNFGRINAAASPITNNTINNFSGGNNSEIAGAIAELTTVLKSGILAHALFGEKEIYTLRKEITKQSTNESTTSI